MILTSDYHTHTTFSHGKGSILDNAVSAKEKGLLEVGISDHGFNHPMFGLRKGKLPKMRELCDLATKQTGVKVLLGIESNIISASGDTDLKKKYYEYFDIFLAGIHKFVMYKPSSYFPLSFPNLFYSAFNAKNVPSWLVKQNTKTFINVIKNNPVDIITHLNFCCFADSFEVAKAAADYGTYIELNSKKTHLTNEELYKIQSTGVNFVISSDAHSPDRVGEISLVEKMLNEVKIEESRIHNVNGRLPSLRFREFKEKL